MKTYRVPFPVYVAAYMRGTRQQPVTEDYLRSKEAEFTQLQKEFPDLRKHLSYKIAVPTGNVDEEVEIEVGPHGVRRVLPNLDQLISQRLTAIHAIVLDTVQVYAINVHNVISTLTQWMETRAVVRVVGAGRANLAASLPANRLAHADALVWILGDRSPLPNTKMGGGIIALSASGKTEQVLEIMRSAQGINRQRRIRGKDEIVVVGISNENAREFRSLCTQNHFLGLRPEQFVNGVLLRGLVDLEEYAMSELLDALVVAAGITIGKNFRLGHEDLGPTGPHHQHSRSR